MTGGGTNVFFASAKHRPAEAGLAQSKIFR